MREQSATRKLGVTLTGSKVHATKLVGASVYILRAKYGVRSRVELVHGFFFISSWSLKSAVNGISTSVVGLFLMFSWDFFFL